MHVKREAADGTIDEVAAEQELVELVAALPDSEVTAQLATWSEVRLDVQPSRAPGGLVGARRALFDKLLAQQRIDACPTLPLARRTSAAAPTSFSQQMQWDFHERANFPTMGIDATAFAVHGALDARAMQQAIGALIGRHASLRTTFRLDRGHLGQTVHDRGIELELVDLSHDPPEVQGARARTLFEAISRPHDLRREVFRAQLVRLDAREHLLFVCPHHIVIDGFAWRVLEADLAALYRSFAAGSAPALAPLELQFTDFCFWQRTLEDRPIGRKQLAFWERSLAGYPGLEVSGDRRMVARGSVGMAMDTYAPGDLPFILDAATFEAVEQSCARLGCTPSTLIATSFLLLLSRWAGRSDVCTLGGNYHRNRPGTEAVVGNFVTQYPLRVSFDHRATLEATVRQCQETVDVNRQHAHVAPSSTLAQLTEWSRYNFHYLVEPTAARAVDFGEVKVERLSWNVLEPRTAHDLALFLREGDRGIRGQLVYNAERFSPELAARAAARLGELIHAITTAPSTRVGDLPTAP